MLFSTIRGGSMHYVLVGLVCLAMASAICCSSVGSSNDGILCLRSERQALLQFKQGIVNQSTALASWKRENDCCKWSGIACHNQTGHVTSLDLSSNNLRGDISPSLLELKYLNYLDLSNNDFGGVMIPKFIGSLSQLKELKLVEANFGGHIPPQLGNLSNLQTLNLSSNHVGSESLEWLSHLSSLRYLNMASSNFSKVVNWPQSLSKLTSLTDLLLDDCSLPVVNPRSLSHINSSNSLQFISLADNYFDCSIFYWIANVSSNAVYIDISYNDLRCPIPDVFTNMPSLVTLNMKASQLEGAIPKGFQNLCRLEELIIWGNKLSGNIEDVVKALSCAKNTLETLDLGPNNFWGSFPQLTGFSKLSALSLFANQLNGSLPESVSQLSSLQELDVRENSMTGAITESLFQNLSRLHDLELSGNNFYYNISSDWNPPFHLTGRLGMSFMKLGPAIPKWILKQTNITVLYLSHAGISGSLPDKFWDLYPRLYVLDLSTNQLRGKLPNLSRTRLALVNLSCNLFSGEVPSFSQDLVQLQLSYNMFSGSLSSLLSTYNPYMYVLELFDNQLSGELPDSWMNFPRLAVLDLGRNKLSGKLPSSFGALKLWLLRLNDNNFSALPSLENSTDLVVVDLSNNNVSGKIPTWLGQSFTNLIILSLRSNQFDGIIPFSLCNLATLHVLDLSHNNISGALPHCLNNTISSAVDDKGNARFIVEFVWKGTGREFIIDRQNLRAIDISSNCLVGEIPESFTSMENLKSLNLSGNYLTGKLPENFGNLKKLESLDLSRNQISGEIPMSFVSLNFLADLNLSHNHLSGRIPIGTQLQTFDASAYMGNPGLCGPPLTPNCSEVAPSPAHDDNEEDDSHDTDGLIDLGFIISAVVGFITAFWIVCGSLLLKRSWRYAYFKVMDDLRDWIYVKMAVFKAKMHRWLQR